VRKVSESTFRGPSVLVREVCLPQMNVKHVINIWRECPVSFVVSPISGTITKHPYIDLIYIYIQGSLHTRTPSTIRPQIDFLVS